MTTWIDVQTLALATLIVLTVALAIPLILYRLLPGERAIQTWTHAAAADAAGILMLFARGKAPDALTIPVANGLLIGGVGLLVIGIRELLGLPARRRWAWGVAALLAAVDLPLALVWPDVWARTVLFVLLFAAWNLVAFVSLWRGAMAASRFLATVFGVAVVLATLRLVGLVASGESVDPLTHSTMRVLDFGGAVFLAFAGTVGCVLFVAEITIGRLRQLALRDALTGLGNRSAIEAAAERELARSKRAKSALGVLLLDVDHFKKVNDRLGHAAGDLALREVAMALRGALRREDELGRYGGEEFLAVLPGASEDDLAIVAERLRAAVAHRVITWNGKRVEVTISIGGSSVASAESTWEAALDRADEAMYAAKAEGRDRFVLRTAEQAAPRRRRSSMSSILRATGE